MSAFEKAVAVPLAAGPEDATKAQTNLTDAYFDRLNKVTEDLKALGTMLVQGIPSNSDDDKDEEEDQKVSKVHTAEEIAQLRHIIINDSRDKCLKKAAKFATCGQEEDGCMMFVTSSGNDVIYGFPIEIDKAMRKKKTSERFDALFALTYYLKEYDFWMHDNEMWGEDGELNTAISKLAATWKKLLTKSSSDLGIDDDFTRPGIMTILDQFKDATDSCEGIEVPFEWN